MGKQRLAEQAQELREQKKRLSRKRSINWLKRTREIKPRAEDLQARGAQALRGCYRGPVGSKGWKTPVEG